MFAFLCYDPFTPLSKSNHVLRKIMSVLSKNIILMIAIIVLIWYLNLIFFFISED